MKKNVILADESFHNNQMQRFHISCSCSHIEDSICIDIHLWEDGPPELFIMHFVRSGSFFDRFKSAIKHLLGKDLDIYEHIPTFEGIEKLRRVFEYYDNLVKEYQEEKNAAV